MKEHLIRRGVEQLTVVQERHIDAAGVACSFGFGATFDAILFLHRGQPRQALDRLAGEPEDLRRWISAIWRQWYAALKAEAAVLTHQHDARERLDRTHIVAIGNPIATAIVGRADALLTGNGDGLLATAVAFDAAQCPYQRARTLVLAGGDHQVEGIAMMTAMGIATPPIGSST